MIIQLKEWQSTSGYWNAAFVDKFSSEVSNSVLCARAIGKSWDEYVKWVLDNFNVSIIHLNLEKDFVGFAWKNQSDMRRYKNAFNKLAREVGYDAQI